MQYLKNEKDYYPWKTFFDNIDTMGEKLRFTANYGVLRVNYCIDDLVPLPTHVRF
jgi:hypothetical protein